MDDSELLQPSQNGTYLISTPIYETLDLCIEGEPGSFRGVMDLEEAPQIALDEMTDYGVANEQESAFLKILIVDLSSIIR